MKKSKTTIGLKAIVLIVGLIAGGVLFVYRGVSMKSSTDLFLGVLLFLFGIGALWINMKSNEFENMPFDEKIKDAKYVEIRSLFRETLLPLGFKEEQHYGRFTTSDYKQEELMVRLGKDGLENFYLFQAATKSKVFVDENRNAHTIPDFDLMVSSSPDNVEGFKNEVRGKLAEWLKEQKIN